MKPAAIGIEKYGLMGDIHQHKACSTKKL